MGMKNRFQEAIQNVQRQRHLARRSVAMVLVLAMLTAMSVSWRLHQDGIALAADDTRYYCGKEEHKHTDDCYIEGTEPICGYEEGEIVAETMDLADDAGDGDASAADWDEAGSEPESEPATQEEPEPEVVLHHHTADCYEEEEVLTCGIESDHVHQDYCYDQETGELLCTEHEHTDDCYTLEEVLVCGQEEGEPEKTDDGAALYDMDENSAEESDFAGESETVADPEPEKEATKPETDDEIDTGYTVHHHTAECYGKVLICGKEEHEHTAACLVNPNAEIDAEYDAKTPDRTSVDWAQDMVLVARSQLGYTESKADVDEDGNGYTMYTAYFEAADAYNQRLAATPNSFFTPEQVSGYDETLDVSGTGIMGYITIPRIGVELPVYHGTSDGVLQVAAGHLEGSSLPVGGAGTHAVISAHRGLPSAKLFTNLDELEAGDTFTITVLDRVLTYEVDRISIVLPTETDLLQPVEGQDYVTLMTCTPYGINTHRLLVRGHRVNTRESQKHVRVTADATRIDPIITAPVIALPMLAVLLIWLLVTTRKRPKAGKHEKTTRGDPHETNS